MLKEPPSAEPLTKEENETVAAFLYVIMYELDAVLDMFPLERLKATASKMTDHAGRAMAMSPILGPSGVREADELNSKAIVFCGFVQLLELRMTARNQYFGNKSQEEALLEAHRMIGL